MAMRRLRISKGGQVSVPAEVRKRWGTGVVTLEDRGTEIVLRPAPDDPVAAMHGALAHLDLPTSDAMRRQARAEEQELEERRGAARP